MTTPSNGALLVLGVVGVLLALTVYGAIQNWGRPSSVYPPALCEAAYAINGRKMCEFTAQKDPMRQCIIADTGAPWCWAKDVKAP